MERYGTVWNAYFLSKRSMSNTWGSKAREILERLELLFINIYII